MEDRWTAIRWAIGTARDRDIVVIAGRGHQDHHDYVINGELLRVRPISLPSFRVQGIGLRPEPLLHSRLCGVWRLRGSTRLLVESRAPKICLQTCMAAPGAACCRLRPAAQVPLPMLQLCGASVVSKACNALLKAQCMQPALRRMCLCALC